MALNFINVNVPAWPREFNNLVFIYIVARINGANTIIGQFLVGRNNGTDFAQQLFVPINYTDTETLTLERRSPLDADGEVQDLL